LPQELPAQFGITGKVNRYWDKNIAIFVFGIFGIQLLLIMQFTRSIDPKRENYKKFENAYAMSRLVDNYLFGIRIAWTLSSPEVWRKTHRLSGGMWMIAGLLILIGVFLSGALAEILIITAIILAVVVPILYSWMISRPLKS
jgi:hypothetical protein